MNDNKKILIFDTSIASKNLGDQIIMDSVKREIKALFPDSYCLNTSTHDVIGKASYRLNKLANLSFVGGTNLLSSNMHHYNQWKINLFDAFFLGGIVLLGVGWWQYQKAPNFYTKYLLNKVLHKEKLHSVRDDFTAKQLGRIGIKNVITTGCPTMWQLSKSHCADIPKKKADAVIFTLTDYNKDDVLDKQFISILKKCYQKLFFWPQGTDDLIYLNKIEKINDIKIIPSSLDNYDKILSDTSFHIDFVGTRLHAGIRALQNKRRTIIIGIDNRAFEKSKKFNLKVIERKDLASLEKTINSDFSTDISLPLNEINLWKAQFK